MKWYKRVIINQNPPKKDGQHKRKLIRITKKLIYGYTNIAFLHLSEMLEQENQNLANQSKENWEIGQLELEAQTQPAPSAGKHA